MANLGKYSRDGKLSSEMSTGILDEKGPVVKQIDSLLWSSDVSIPQYLPMVEPWYRYQEYESAIRQNYKGEHLVKNIHPTTTREVAIIKHNETFLSRRILANMICRPTRAMLTWSKRFECSAFWCNMSMKLLKIDGKAAPGTRTCFGSIPEWKNKTGTAMVHPTATATAIATIAATTRAADKKKKKKGETRSFRGNGRKRRTIQNGCDKGPVAKLEEKHCSDESVFLRYLQEGSQSSWW